MCELFGFSSSENEELNEYLRKFYDNCHIHPHGWGLNILDDDKYFIAKEPVQARCSVLLGNILLNPIVCKNLFAHIRFATIGNLNFYNCHPFVKKDNHGRRWTLIHNGTIFDSEELCKYNIEEDGDTDSERVLLYIIDTINLFEEEKGEPLELKERFDIISDLIKDLSYNNKLNLMVYDGEQIIVHSNLKDSLFYLKKEHSIMFSSHILNEEDWKIMPLNTVFSFAEGKMLFKSEAHSNEYIMTEEQINFINKFVESLELGPEDEYVW